MQVQFFLAAAISEADLCLLLTELAWSSGSEFPSNETGKPAASAFAMVHSDQKAILKKLLNFNASGYEEKRVAQNALILSKFSG